MKGTLKKINLVYYAIYSITILSTIVGYLLTSDSLQQISPKSQLSINLSSILIIYILISIPLSLYLFYKNVKKWKLLEDNMTKLDKYEKGSIYRLVAVGLGLIASIAIFFILRSVSIIYCAGIAAIALIFCKPTESKIISDLGLDEDED